MRVCNALWRCSTTPFCRVWYAIVCSSISSIALSQDPCTSLLTTATHSPHHAWIRDNVYAVHAMWATHLAFRKRADKDEDVRTANELALMAVKCMQVRYSL